MEQKEPYKKSVDDELDLKLVDQLSGTVAQISNFCFETKKFCITTQFVVLPLIAKFTSDKLDHSIFVAGLAIPFCFWFLDAVAYYYQVKMRGKMKAILDEVKERISKHNNVELASDTASVIDSKRINKSKFGLLFSAAINHSMWTYLLLAAVNCLVWYLYCTGTIK